MLNKSSACTKYAFSLSSGTTSQPLSFFSDYEVMDTNAENLNRQPRLKSAFEGQTLLPGLPFFLCIPKLTAT